MHLPNRTSGGVECDSFIHCSLTSQRHTHTPNYIFPCPVSSGTEIRVRWCIQWTMNPPPPALSFFWKSHLLHTLPQSAEFKLLKTHQRATPVHSISCLVITTRTLGFILMQFHKDKRTESVLICSYKCAPSSCWRTDCLNWISICVFSFRTWLYRFQSSTGHNRLRVECKSGMLSRHMLSRFRVLLPFCSGLGRHVYTLPLATFCSLRACGNWLLTMKDLLTLKSVVCAICVPSCVGQL